MKNAWDGSIYNILFETPERKRPLSRHTHRLKKNVKIIRKKVK
jgi:hypothetical protein